MTNNNQLQKDDIIDYVWEKQSEGYREIAKLVEQSFKLYPNQLTQARERVWDNIQNKKSPE